MMDKSSSLVMLVQITPITTIRISVNKEKLSNSLRHWGSRVAVDKGTVRDPMAVQRVPAALWLFHPWGAWVWGARVWGARLAGPLDVITQPVKLLSRPKISHSGKSQSGTFLFSFEFSTSIFCIFPPKKKKRHTEISCVFWQTSFHILVLVFFPLILCQDQIPLESLFVSLYPSTQGKTLYDYL